jgi:OmpA-OmpF porin, OOP family
VNKYAAAGMVSLALAGSVQGAAAQNSDAKSGGTVSPWYVGAGIGQTFASIPEQTIDGINSALITADGASFSVIDKDKRSAGSKFFAGYTFNPYLAAEGGYAALGNSTVNMNFLNGAPISASVGSFNMKYKMTAFFIDAVGFLPVYERLSLFGRVGVSYNDVDASFSGKPTTFIISGNNTSATKVREKFGAGIDYSLNPAFTVRAEWERYKMPDPFSDELFNVDTATLSLLYHF